jgi:hypothetical protein
MTSFHKNKNYSEIKLRYINGRGVLCQLKKKSGSRGYEPLYGERH